MGNTAATSELAAVFDGRAGDPGHSANEKTAAKVRLAVLADWRS